MDEKSLADMLAEGEVLFVSCTHPTCYRSNKTVKLDIQALADRLGPEHGAMHWDPVRLFRCTSCDAEGRDRRPVMFTCIPDYAGDTRRRNARWKPTFEPGDSGRDGPLTARSVADIILSDDSRRLSWWARHFMSRSPET